jgi:hypothetical protein
MGAGCAALRQKEVQDVSIRRSMALGKARPQAFGYTRNFKASAIQLAP